MSASAPAASPFTGESEIMIGEEIRRTSDLLYTWDDEEDLMRVYAVPKQKGDEVDDEEEEEEAPTGVLVGRLQCVRERINDADELWLSEVDVAPHMQRRGIGTTLVELALEFDLSHVPAVEQHDNYRYCLSVPGQRLVARCIESGLIPIELCYFSSAQREHNRPWSTALLKSSADGGEKRADPQLDSAVILQAIANRKAGVVTPSQAASKVAQQ